MTGIAKPWVDPNAQPMYQIPMLGNGAIDYANIDMNALNESLRGYGGTPTTVGGTGPMPSIPGSPQAAQFQWGNNIPTWSLGFQGLGALTNLWQGLEANKIAKQSLAMQKEFGNINLNNSIRSYNTALENRADHRAVNLGWDDAQKQAWLDANRATR